MVLQALATHYQLVCGEYVQFSVVKLQKTAKQTAKTDANRANQLQSISTIPFVTYSPPCIADYWSKGRNPTRKQSHLPPAWGENTAKRQVLWALRPSPTMNAVHWGLGRARNVLARKPWATMTTVCSHCNQSWYVHVQSSNASTHTLLALQHVLHTR